ncbi:MAG: permease-like cell division protein FtsX [Acidimicrobiales bacterium]|nr:permease-like cell division protein FtsX [Acidimicrobiales bacterium]
MALKLDYMVRETGTNLVRNFSLTFASILTVAVSLSLVGAALLVRGAVDNATARWEGGIEFIVFLQPEASDDQTDAVERALGDSPQVEGFSYVDQEETFQEFQDLFADSPQIVDTVSPDILPPSFRVVPTSKEADVISGLRTQFETQPGVREVVAATDTIRTIQNLSSLFQRIAFGVAAALVVAASLLVLNSIRMAMFARRREIEVMKLVGASNWFIRVPFMLEGVVQGLLGSVVALGTAFGVRAGLSQIATDRRFTLFAGFTVDAGQFRLTGVLILVTGILIGALGSAFAVSRFLDV